MERLLSSTEAAAWLGASPTSVKRWADAGLIECVRTAGNHRRFRVEALERFTQGADPKTNPDVAEPAGDGRGVVGAPDEADGGFSLPAMLQANPHALRALLLGERARVESWAEVGDRVGPVLTELGAAWQRGEIDVVQEHLASERLSRALVHLSEALPIAPSAPCAMLATAAGDEHTLGLSLAELTLREAGWRTLWSGRRTPVGQLARALRQGSVRLLAISASTYSDDAEELAEFVEAALEACAQADASLVVGGRGAWPRGNGRFIHARSFRALRDLALAQR